MHIIALEKQFTNSYQKRYKKRSKHMVALHARPAAEFFEQAWKKGKELPANRGGFAYLYGFICHFVLDHSCHGYIEEKIQKSGVTIHYLSASVEWQFLRERENFSFSDVRKKTSIESESIIW